jgi:hypothetical protein
MFGFLKRIIGRPRPSPGLVQKETHTGAGIVDAEFNDGGNIEVVIAISGDVNKVIIREIHPWRAGSRLLGEGTSIAEAESRRGEYQNSQFEVLDPDSMIQHLLLKARDGLKQQAKGAI